MSICTPTRRESLSPARSSASKARGLIHQEWTKTDSGDRTVVLPQFVVDTLRRVKAEDHREGTGPRLPQPRRRHLGPPQFPTGRSTRRRRSPGTPRGGKTCRSPLKTEKPGSNLYVRPGHSSPIWTRTRNLPINSRLLCQLSYRGLSSVALPFRAGRGETLAYRPSGSQIALLPAMMPPIIVGAAGAGGHGCAGGGRIDRGCAFRAGW